MIYSISNPESAKSNEEWFDECYKWYPHNPARKSKQKARKKFMDIVKPGGVDTQSLDKDAGGYTELHLEATPEEIFEGVKDFRKAMTPANTYTPETRYVPAMEVWLNSGRYET